jgi:hypothetical protein
VHDGKKVKGVSAAGKRRRYKARTPGYQDSVKAHQIPSIELINYIATHFSPNTHSHHYYFTPMDKGDRAIQLIRNFSLQFLSSNN